jgi:hypothetical protein
VSECLREAAVRHPPLEGQFVAGLIVDDGVSLVRDPTGFIGVVIERLEVRCLFSLRLVCGAADAIGVPEIGSVSLAGRRCVRNLVR